MEKKLSNLFWEKNISNTIFKVDLFKADYDEIVSTEAKKELAEELIKEGYENWGNQIKSKQLAKLSDLAKKHNLESK